MNSPFSNRVFTGLLGHIGLTTAIVADYFRRSAGEDFSALLALVSLVGLLIGGGVFVRSPAAFFMAADSDVSAARFPNLLWRAIIWLIVVGAPVLWLLSVMHLTSLAASTLTTRFIGSYSFFAWVVATLILWPHLFQHRGDKPRRH